MLFAEIDTGSVHLLAARAQMTLTLVFHISLACLGVGMPLLMVLAEWRFLRTGDELWRTIAKRWSKAFLVLFAIGAVSGTVLSFELGLFWPNLMGKYGSVIALPFTLEGFAFFTEAIFGAIYLYGWDRLPAKTHWLAGWPVAISGMMSAWFVVTANSWMNCPRGFVMGENGSPESIDPFAVMLNPATWPMTLHMIFAAYVVSGFAVAAFYAFLLLRGNPHREYCRRAMVLGVVIGAVCILPQAMVGHWAGQRVADPNIGQPIKFAAMEGHFETEKYAALHIGGYPDVETGEMKWSIAIPGMLSFLAFNDPAAEVPGLNDFDRSLWPNVVVTHFSFQIMVGIGTMLILLSAWCAFSRWKYGRLPKSSFFLWVIVLSGPAAWLAMQAGWFATEVGRQPWVVQPPHELLAESTLDEAERTRLVPGANEKYVKVAEPRLGTWLSTRSAVTDAPGIGLTLALTTGVYVILGIGSIVALRLLANVPLPQEQNEDMEANASQDEPTAH